MDVSDERRADAPLVEIPMRGIDDGLVRTYLELQVRWLRLQLADAERRAASVRSEREVDTRLSGLVRTAVPTLVVVLCITFIAVIVDAGHWKDLNTAVMGYSNVVTSVANNDGSTTTVSTALPPNGMQTVINNLRSLAPQTVNALAAWKDVILAVLGTGFIVTWRRWAWRSTGRALPIVLAVLLTGAVFTLLAVADHDLVDYYKQPWVSIPLRGWAVLIALGAIAFVLMREIADLAISAVPSGHATRHGPQARRADGVVRFGKRGSPSAILSWLIAPRSWWQWLCVLAIGIVVWLGSTVAVATATAGTEGTPPTAWGALPFVLVPCLGAAGLISASSSLRAPTRGPKRSVVFTVAPLVALSAYTIADVTPVYSNVGSWLTLFVVSFVAWPVWATWAAIALPGSLRLIYVPLLVAVGISLFMLDTTIPLLGTAAVLSVAVPDALRRAERSRDRLDPRTSPAT